MAGLLFPASYDETVNRRWGVDLKVGSPVLSLAILVPVEEDRRFAAGNWPEKRSVTRQTRLTRGQRLSTLCGCVVHAGGEAAVPGSGRKYRLLTEALSLPSPVMLRMWLDQDPQLLSPRLNPQCVYWSMARG
ncbi:hypothetical protein PR048_032572 [Dryococelus australis]|uniref:Uncharacterized protein n=1 Tax=Dryococelus australis TaxID=614101 RepID=A0ABQ9G5F5_9NEOP|nr:hypothetical protein PR048_032572 [Dryococelus australis]